MPTLGDFLPKCAFFFAREVDPSPEDLVPGKREAADVARVLQTAAWALEDLDPWSRDEIEKAVKRVGDFWEWPIRDVTKPMFAAIMGQPVGPPLYDSIALLHVDMTRSRLLSAVGLLGGISKKKLRSLEKEWR
jgi:glutamyl-tRNA synthetase